MKKKMILKLLAISFTIISIGCALTACNCGNNPGKTNKPQYVDIIVKHPVTGEVINEYGWMEFAYDENFVMPEITLKLRDKNIFLTDKDFENGSWVSHMQLYIDKDGTYMEQRSWKNDWPKEVGQYELMLKFNEDGWVKTSHDDKKYYASIICFTLKIT